MNISWRALSICLATFVAMTGMASAEELQTMEFTVDGVTRTALVYVPPGAKSTPLPLVFAFHGHGGNSNAAVRKFEVDRLWPEAISVYPQGLNTPGRLTDPTGVRPGWQKAVGDQGDRDLHFFDAMLARLEKSYPVDPSRIYSVGHSNGAGFTYLLWYTHPKVLAAVAICSGASAYADRLPPKPAIIFGGQNDELIPFDTQAKMMSAVRRGNGCAESGEPWQGGATLYPSKSGTPAVTFIYPGGHAMDPAEPGLFVKFFQQHPGSASAAGPRGS